MTVPAVRGTVKIELSFRNDAIIEENKKYWLCWVVLATLYYCFTGEFLLWSSPYTFFPSRLLMSSNCLIISIVPNEPMKIARVIPYLNPMTDQSLFTNYLPVSVLASFSKFLERIIYNCLMHYLKSFNILHLWKPIRFLKRSGI